MCQKNVRNGIWNWVLWADLRYFLRLYYLADYSMELEEGAFRGRTADFFYMIVFGATIMTGIVLIGSMVPYVSASFVGIYFLSDSLIIMMVSQSQPSPFRETLEEFILILMALFM